MKKYENVKIIFEKEKNNTKIIKLNCTILNYEFNKLKIEKIKVIAQNIHIKYNSKKEFNNNGYIIVVNKSGINECIEKIYNNRKQREFLNEHLNIFINLDMIIKNAILINQSYELKGRKQIKHWNYYLIAIEIYSILYLLEFDVRTLDNGENQYRVQRLKKIKTDDYYGDVVKN